MKFSPWFALILGFGLVIPLHAADDPEELFQQALKMRQEGNYVEAATKLQQILASNPTLGRAKAELALTLMKSLRFAESKSQAEQLLNDPNVPEDVKVTLRKLLDRIAKESQTHTFTPTINIGLFHDDNVNVGPSSDSFDILGTTFLLTPGARPQSDNGVNLNAAINHRYLSPKTIDIGDMKAALLWLSDASFSRVDYNNLGDYDTDILSLRTGPTLVVAGKGRLGVYGQYDDIRLGHDAFADYTTLGADFGFKVSKFDMQLSGRVQDREYDAAVNSGRDSTYKDMTLSASYPLKEDKLSLIGAIRFFDEDASNSRFSNDGHEVTLGAVWQAWSSGAVKAIYSRRSSDYGIDPFTTTDRDDDLDRLTLEVNHEFSGGIMNSWTLSGYMVARENDSNVTLYDYDRRQVGVNLGRKF